MDQTQGPAGTDQPQGGTTTEPGINRGNLRNYEQLRRSVTDRKVAGVAGGLGRHLGVDPTILRVLFVVLCFFGGAGLVAYGAAWLLVPEEGRSEGTLAMSPGTRNALLIGAGVVAALLLVGDSWGGIGFPWPLFLVGVGVLVFLAARDRGARTESPLPGTPGPDYSPEYAAPDHAAPAYTAPGYAVDGPPADTGSPTSPAWLPTEQPAAGPPSPRPRRGHRLFGPTLALVALALGTLGLYDVAGGRVDDAAYPALSLAVVGAMLVVGAFVGRAGGLILLGLLAAAALAVSSTFGSFNGLDISEGKRVSVVPTSASEVLNDYTVTSGQVLYLDLSRVAEAAQLDGRVIDVRGRVGELVVVLPRGVETDVTATVGGPGQIDLPDRSTDGISPDLAGVYGAGGATVAINAHLSVGHIDVRNP